MASSWSQGEVNHAVNTNTLILRLVISYKRGDGMLPSFCFSNINITCINKTELKVIKIIKTKLKKGVEL
jgi:hypothetical protein